MIPAYNDVYGCLQPDSAQLASSSITLIANLLALDQRSAAAADGDFVLGRRMCLSGCAKFPASGYYLRFFQCLVGRTFAEQSPKGIVDYDEDGDVKP